MIYTKKLEIYMKKLYIPITLILLSLCLTACHGKEAREEQDSSAQAENSENQITNNDSSEAVLFYPETESASIDTMFLIDKNGEKKSDLSEIIQNIEQNGMRSDNESLFYYQFINGILFFRFYSADSPIDGYYALDIANCKTSKIICDEYTDYIDYYNGKLYLGSDNMYEKDTEYAFSVSDDFSFVPEETNLQKILDYTVEYRIAQAPYCVYSRHTGFSISRALNEFGFVIGSRFNNGKKEFIKIFPDGTNEEIKELYDKECGIIYYDKDTIILASGDLDTIEYAKDIYTYDLKNKSLKHILNIDDKSIIQFSDNKLFLRGKGKAGSLYVYDFEKETETLIYKYEEKLGTFIYSNYQYQIINGNIFVCDIENAELRWYRIDAYEDTYKAVDIECHIDSVPAYKIGTVIPYNSETNCPFCGNKVQDSSYELFQLSDEYSEHTSKINEMLKKKKDQFLNDHSEIECYIEDDSDCAYHQDFDADREESLSEAIIYNSRFLTVTMNYWWFAGGPHGFYHSDIYIFDLSTGEELGIKNFYPGTETDFKALIGEKIKEDYNDCPEHYGDRSIDDSYDGAYSLASFDSTSIRYYDDHITYCFDVYEMGTYADGEYRVDVTYEELNGHSTLTRVK